MSLSIFPELAEDVDVLESFSMQLKNPNSVAEFSLLVELQSSADFTELKSVLGENEVAAPSFNGKYEGSPFNATLSVSVTMPETENASGAIESGTTTLVSLKLIDYNSNPGYTASELEPNKIKIEGQASKVFTDEIYEFLMPDLKTVKSLSADTEETYAAIVKWVPPRIKEIILMHYVTVVVTYDESATGSGLKRYTSVLTLTLPQTIRWNYTPAVAQFNQLLQRGTI